MKRYSLGLDIGSVDAKLALIDKDSSVIHLDFERVTTGPKSAVIALLSRLAEKVNLDDIGTAGVVGSGKGVIPSELNWTSYSDPLAIISGLLISHPDARTIIQVGGQTSMVVEVEDGLRKPWKVASNPLCAAGTGRFLEQQAYRLGISLEDFARLALSAEGTPPRIAARCSVFAKTDLIHLQQKGVPIESILYSLSDSVARMVASFKKGPFKEPVYFTGGVAANAAVVSSFNEVISARNKHRTEVTVPDNHLYIESLGCALLARDSQAQSKVVILEEEELGQRYFIMPKLERYSQSNVWVPPTIDQPFEGYLGIDVGSTSTKGIILDEAGQTIMAKSYLMTAGQPLEAVKQVLSNLYAAVGDNAKIAGVGVTGSGRYLIGSFIGADLIKNEITAQTRAAEDLAPDADIIEIGGQDAKLVIKRNGVVVDYQMNKACAAGTGSFIDELAEMLGVQVTNGQFADLAFEAPYLIDLGSRCASFMGQAVASAQQEGVPLEIITASLASSIARNYLSKVVEMRRLGDEVVLTGAVFYNEAVVAAFQQLMEKTRLVVPKHKEVTGAIGSALLAKEEMAEGGSRFRGFQKLIEEEYELRTFTCNRCDNNCTISRLQMEGEPPTFYGSRCDLYDSTVSHEKKETAFDDREALLFAGYDPEAEGKLTVGVPRALLMYDFAPLLIGFLNELGVKTVFSNKTNRNVIERATELSYTDSCFPIKLLHGHTDNLQDVDHIIIPSFLRLGIKEGEENQKYACPLVQAAPFLIREALRLHEKLIVPLVDFSMGDKEVIDQFTRVARKMGFNRIKGKRAAKAGLAAQREFEKVREEHGRELLKQVQENNQIGVVIIARAYMAQDSGANLGIAEQLAQLGVVPIPLDYLPLSSVDISQYSDRPYWEYERKFIAGAHIVANTPHLYGLTLTNFGCGPNSIILNLVEDIIGSEPLGQLEIDEHAAEAGIVTRIEAFVDTIKGFDRSGQARTITKDIYRSAELLNHSKGIILLPRMCPHAEVMAAAFNAYGVEAVALPPANENNLLYSNKFTSGKECLPYRVTLGDFLKLYYENGHNLDLSKVEGFMAGAYGPCRLGKYAPEQGVVLKEIGFDLPIRTSVSNNAYRDWGLGVAFERFMWKGIVAYDHLQKLLWRSRPYEASRGMADEAFNELTGAVSERISRRESYDDILRDAVPKFKALIDSAIPRKPLVGINGEIFLRSNDFSNNHLVRNCEEAGLEVVVSPFGEWIKYLALRNIEDGISNRQGMKIIKGYIRRKIQFRDESSVLSNFGHLVDVEEPTIEEILDFTKAHLSPRCGSEAVLSVGTGLEWMVNPQFAGVISVMPHGCMPGGIVAAMSESLSVDYNKPWISLTYDGSMESNNLVKIHNFAEILRFSGNGA